MEKEYILHQIINNTHLSFEEFYAGKNGIVLSMHVLITPYYLVKDISPNSKKKIKLPRDKDYNCIVSPNKDEYLILYFK